MGRLTLDAERVKRHLVEPWQVLSAIGLADGAKRQAGGAVICCPWHAERNPSCSVRIGANGTLAAHCFGCGQGGDVFSLVATVRGLNERSDFARVVAEAARIAGLDGAAPLPPPPRRPLPPPRILPPPGEVEALYARCGKVADDRELCAQLRTRRIDPAAVTDLDLARVLPPGALPAWCAYWRRSGHRLIFGRYDSRGNLASIHGRTLGMGGTIPKGVGPTGFAGSGMVMADAAGRDLLATASASPWWSGEVHIAEGATDFLTLASRWGDSAERVPATLGITAGAWNQELADRIPGGAVVRILTDPDEAGERYAAQIVATLSHCRVDVVKMKKEADHGAM